MTDAMEVDASDREGESWRPLPPPSVAVHEDAGCGHGHANKETGFASKEESPGRKAHAVVSSSTSPTAEEDESSRASNLIEAGDSSAAAGKRSPPLSMQGRRQRPPPPRLLLLTTTSVPTKQNIPSRELLPDANTQGNMTINQHLLVCDSPAKSSAANNGQVEAMAVDIRRVSEEGSEDVPMNLVSGPREEAVNLSSRCNNEERASPIIGLSAKMRLKKQRLEAAAQAAAELNQAQQRPGALFNSTFSDNSALHRLAEAAERKQEEEMLDMTEASPINSSSNNTTITANFKFMPLRGGGEDVVSITPLPPQNHHTPSPDSAVHSVVSGCYSPSQSPVQSRQVSGVSSPFSLVSLSRNNSDASQRGSPSTLHLSSPHDSPVQVRHTFPPQGRLTSLPLIPDQNRPSDENDLAGAMSAQPGISRQQLINSPCPVCGDKISGFHYGIFSCESCKGFFKRTVQNKKNYQCLRGANCPVSIATRKKCPACRFNKCLNTGMKLEAIREDRTRGGRSTYQCSYTLPAGITNNHTTIPTVSLPTLPLPPFLKAEEDEESERLPSIQDMQSMRTSATPPTTLVSEDTTPDEIVDTNADAKNVPVLIQEIMDVEHLWFSTRPMEKNMEMPMEESSPTISSDESMVQTLTNMADKRLFKLVKWCKSLPLFKNILIDDQISLLINAWCELLVFSCCYRSMETPGVIRVSNQKRFTLETARQLGIEKWIEKMLHFSEQLRRLKVDCYEYVSMKVIVLLTSGSSSTVEAKKLLSASQACTPSFADASGLKEPSHVRDSQEKVVQALQHYTATQYPDMPSKFAELLLRMPELHRVCQGCKEMLCPKQPAEGEMPGFNLLMELLRGDH